MDSSPSSYSHLNTKQRKSRLRHIRNRRNRRARRLLEAQAKNNSDNINNSCTFSLASFSPGVLPFEPHLSPSAPSPPRVPSPELHFSPPLRSELESILSSGFLCESSPQSPHIPPSWSPSLASLESPFSFSLTYRIFPDIPNSSPQEPSYLPVFSPL